MKDGSSLQRRDRDGMEIGGIWGFSIFHVYDRENEELGMRNEEWRKGRVKLYSAPLYKGYYSAAYASKHNYTIKGIKVIKGYETYKIT